MSCCCGAALLSVLSWWMDIYKNKLFIQYKSPCTCSSFLTEMVTVGSEESGRMTRLMVTIGWSDFTAGAGGLAREQKIKKCKTNIFESKNRIYVPFMSIFSSALPSGLGLVGVALGGEGARAAHGPPRASHRAAHRPPRAPHGASHRAPREAALELLVAEVVLLVHPLLLLLLRVACRISHYIFVNIC